MTDDPEAKAFFDQFEQDVLPNMKASMFVMVLHGEPDAKLCLEVGAAVLLEKPLLLLVQPDAFVPPLLRKLATRVVEVDRRALNEETKQRVADACLSVMEEIQRSQQ